MISRTPSKLPRRCFGAAILIVSLATVLILGPPVAFHALPPAYTGEADRLAEALRLSAGDTLAEIGAGNGALALAMHERLHPGGLMYATELDPNRLSQLRSRGDGKLVVIEASESATGLPEDCCDAVFMRNVYHHIGDSARFNEELRRVLRAGGRLAIIDFEPGTFRSLRSPPAGTSSARTGHGVTAAAIAQELTSAGFRIARVEPDWGGWMFLVVAVAP